METFTIKGLYLNAVERKNPTFYGTLKECINYVDKVKYRFLHFGNADIKICVGEQVYAIKRCITNYDNIGEYYTFTDWEILRG